MWLPWWIWPASFVTWTERQRQRRCTSSKTVCINPLYAAINGSVCSRLSIRFLLQNHSEHFLIVSVSLEILLYIIIGGSGGGGRTKGCCTSMQICDDLVFIEFNVLIRACHPPPPPQQKCDDLSFFSLLVSSKLCTTVPRRNFQKDHLLLVFKQFLSKFCYAANTDHSISHCIVHQGPVTPEKHKDTTGSCCHILQHRPASGSRKAV